MATRWNIFFSARFPPNGQTHVWRIAMETIEPARGLTRLKCINKYSKLRLIHPRLLQPTAYYIQIAWDGIFLISPIIKTAVNPSTSVSPCRQTIFSMLWCLNALKAEVDFHIRKAFVSKQTTLRSFSSAEEIGYKTSAASFLPLCARAVAVLGK